MLQDHQVPEVGVEIPMLAGWFGWSVAWLLFERIVDDKSLNVKVRLLGFLILSL